MYQLTWLEILGRLKTYTPEQLNKPVIGLIDGEPWEASKFKLSEPDDEWKPNQPYLVFE